MLSFLVAAVVFLSPAQAQNPYCPPPGGTPPLAPACDDDHHPDYMCEAQCKTQYQFDVAAAYADGCSQWDAAEADFNEAVDAAIDDMDSCLAGATTQAQRAACRNAAYAAINQANSTFQAEASAIAASVAAGKNAATMSYVACSTGCCVHN